MPDGLLLPDLYADMNFFLDCSKHLDNFIGLLTDLKQNGSEKSYDLVSWSIYFNLALDVLTELNRMNREVHETGESVSIGMELSTGSYTTHIFPDTTFNPSMVGKKINVICLLLLYSNELFVSKVSAFSDGNTL